MVPSVLPGYAVTRGRTPETATSPGSLELPVSWAATQVTAEK
ncbi:hypothetical protein OHS58_09630 [Amycolatopsis sp. NBC_00348]